MTAPDNLLRSEKVCIGCAVESHEILTQLVGDGLRAEDFSTSTHRRIWSGLTDMAASGVPVDVISVCSHLGDSEHDFATITDACFGVVVDASHAFYHAQLIRRSAQVRRLLLLSDSIQESVVAGWNPDAIEERARQILDGSPIRRRGDFATDAERATT
jgi:replicative DNA helicase